MPRPQRYVDEKLGRALKRLNTRSGSLAKRVRDAWEEMHVLRPDELVNAASREDFRVLEETPELFVIEGATPKLSDAVLRDLSERIRRIHDANVR